MVEYSEDDTMSNLMRDVRASYMRPTTPITVCTCTWNVNNMAPGPGALKWMRSKYRDGDIYVIALQEVDLRKRAMVTDAAMQVSSPLIRM